MKITTSLAVAFACATLAACGGGGNEANNDLNVDTLEANTLVTDNMGTDMNMDMNATTDMNMDMNTDLNATTNMDANTTTTNTL